MFEHSGLLTDLYELTMAAGYLQTRFEARATFELFVRHLPPHRNYLVAAGLEQALDFLENVRFSAEEIDYLRQHPVFRSIRGEFFDYLAKFRFTGDVFSFDAQLPDPDRQQSGARCHRGETTSGRRIRRAPRAWQSG
jgi:nicotinic acid phosphoribosyltransferase